MTLDLLALLAAALVVVVAATQRLGWALLSLVVILGTLTLFPKSLSSDPNTHHAGIAPSVPVATTYIVALVALGYILLVRSRRSPSGRSVPISAYVFIIFLGVGLVAIWHGSEEQFSGAIQLGLGYLAWVIGGQLGPLVLSQERRVLWLSYAIAGIVSLETLVGLLQKAGFAINPLKHSVVELVGSRVNGTTDHPDNLGKIMVLLLILCLGLMGTRSARTRRVLWFSIVLLFIPLGLSEGRANLLAALTAIVLWAVLSGRRRSLAIRVGIPLTAALIVLPFVGAIASRIQEDPNGGPRSNLEAAAIEQIHRQPWGTGPNSYVSVVSSHNAIVAEGFPVHNTFLLTAAELGLVGAVLFWLPVIGILILAFRSYRRPGYSGAFAIAIIASAPGLYVMNATGWAMLSDQLLPLWFLVYGIAYSQLLPRRQAKVATQPAPGLPDLAPQRPTAVV